MERYGLKQRKYSDGDIDIDTIMSIKDKGLP